MPTMEERIRSILPNQKEKMKETLMEFYGFYMNEKDKKESSENAGPAISKRAKVLYLLRGEGRGGGVPRTKVVPLC